MVTQGCVRFIGPPYSVAANLELVKMEGFGGSVVKFILFSTNLIILVSSTFNNELWSAECNRWNF